MACFCCVVWQLCGLSMLLHWGVMPAVRVSSLQLLEPTAGCSGSERVAGCLQHCPDGGIVV